MAGSDSMVEVTIIYPDSPQRVQTAIQVMDINGTDLLVKTVKEHLLQDKPHIKASDYSLGFHDTINNTFVMAKESDRITDYYQYLHDAHNTVVVILIANA
ncbi:hypothetical protein Btru_072097 [Bulinus truncatus]|nr:hypothetical protein Btru_072097 [Bulinus truncatus]